MIATAVRRVSAGLEALVGIPGTVGAPCGRTLAAAAETSASGRAADGAHRMVRFSGASARPVFAYRESNLDDLVILSGSVSARGRRPRRADQADAEAVDREEANQPLSHQPQAASSRNPRGMSAGMLIDQAGLKGTRASEPRSTIGTRTLLRPTAGATASDVQKLIELIHSRVAERLGVDLQTELEILVAARLRANDPDSISRAREGRVRCLLRRSLPSAAEPP